MWEGIGSGFSTALTPINILMVCAGCFAGTFIGLLPGLGPISAIALMIPITYGFDPATGMILLAGVYYGAIFGGSTSSILINAPGVSGTVAVFFRWLSSCQERPSWKSLSFSSLFFIFWRDNSCFFLVGRSAFTCENFFEFPIG